MEPGNDINKTTFIQRYIKLKKKYDEKYAWLLLFLIQKMQNYNYDTFPCFDTSQQLTGDIWSSVTLTLRRDGPRQDIAPVRWRGSNTVTRPSS